MLIISNKLFIFILSITAQKILELSGMIGVDVQEIIYFWLLFYLMAATISFCIDRRTCRSNVKDTQLTQSWQSPGWWVWKEVRNGRETNPISKRTERKGEKKQGVCVTGKLKWCDVERESREDDGKSRHALLWFSRRCVKIDKVRHSWSYTQTQTEAHLKNTSFRREAIRFHYLLSRSLLYPPWGCGTRLWLSHTHARAPPPNTHARTHTNRVKRAPRRRSTYKLPCLKRAQNKNRQIYSFNWPAIFLPSSTCVSVIWVTTPMLPKAIQSFKCSQPSFTIKISFTFSRPLFTLSVHFIWTNAYLCYMASAAICSEKLNKINCLFTCWKA